MAEDRSVPESLKRIEEKHGPLRFRVSRVCDWCDEPLPCDVVKLARALADAHRRFTQIGYHAWADKCGQTLAEVAGGGE